MSPLRLIQSLGNSGFNTTVLGSARQSSYGVSPLGEAENKRHRGKDAVFTGLCLKAPMLGNRSLDARHSQKLISTHESCHIGRSGRTGACACSVPETDNNKK